MRTFYPGQITLSLIMLLAGTLLVMDRFDMIQIIRIQDLWPVTLIAAGLEELFHWAVSKNCR